MKEAEELTAQEGPHLEGQEEQAAPCIPGDVGLPVSLCGAPVQNMALLVCAVWGGGWGGRSAEAAIAGGTSAGWESPPWPGLGIFTQLESAASRKVLFLFS